MSIKLWAQSIVLGFLAWAAGLLLLGTSAQIEVPITYTGLSGDLAVQSPNNTVNVQAKGPRWLLLNMTDQDFRAKVNLSDVEAPGQYNRVIEVESLNNLVQISDSTKETTLEVVEATEKEVGITIHYENHPPDGYSVNQASVSPQTVTAIGSENALNQLDSVSATVDLKNRITDFSGTAKVESKDLQNRPRTNLAFAPSIVQVQVDITEGEFYTHAGLDPQFTGNLPSGMIVSHVNVQPMTVTLRGSREVLANVQTVPTTPINLDGRSSNFQTQIGVEVPPEAEVVGDNLITANVQLSTLRQSKRLSVRPSFENLTEGLSISSVTPQTFEAVMIGQSDALSELSEEDLELTVDLQGLVSGEHTIELTEGNFAVQSSSITIASFSPQSLNLEIINNNGV